MATRQVLIVFITLLMIGCANQQSANIQHFLPSENLYLDERFPNAKTILIESSDEVFAINDEMRLMVETELGSIKDPGARAKKLLKHLFSNEHVNLAYESDANLTASQAYHSKTANCMSLTIMAYALAKEAGLNVEFQDVKVPEYWVRNGQYNLLTGHVNLLVKRSVEVGTTIVWGNTNLVIDFDPFVVKKSFPKRIVGKDTILAMFYTNKGAQALVNNELDKAYAYLKQATLTDPSFASSWGNLGILYRFIDQLELAEKTYNHTLLLEPENLTVMNNLAMTLRKKGDIEKANAINRKLHQLRISNPYYHALLADEAFFNGNNEQALTHYKRAIRLDNSVHEFYYGLAKVYYAEHDYERAKSAVKKAIRLNKTSESIENQYIAKLNWLKQQDYSAN